ncbi:hypothetical protein C8J56DRAFT_1046714 [Mycena floridula]|nr:hypothetical protein C8J56DRAFT_1046714 [Mycena floridula]
MASKGAALVSGSFQSISKAIALQLAQDGYDLMLKIVLTGKSPGVKQIVDTAMAANGGTFLPGSVLESARLVFSISVQISCTWVIFSTIDFCCKKGSVPHRKKEETSPWITERTDES